MRLSRKLALCAQALVALLLVGGCGDSTGPAGKQGSTQQAAQTAVQTQSASAQAQSGAKTVTVGSIGGALRLDDRTGAIYSIELRDGAAFLQGAAVLRGADRGWYDREQLTAPSAMRNPGIGASLGKHMVVVTPKADALWIDDSTRVELTDGNVALFEGAGQTLTHAGSVAIDSYLGPAPIEDASQRKALVQGRLAQLLKNSSTIGAAWTN